MPVRAEDLASRPFLAHPSVFEDEHVVGDTGHDTEVMADEQNAEAEVALELSDEVEDRGLHRRVERRSDLVADEHLG
jgi:hypothetical protein